MVMDHISAIVVLNVIERINLRNSKIRSGADAKQKTAKQEQK
jgi:hypothetical protein